ncbi:efflux RND transporter periplasmic adaptor subunit [Novosphingobium acidiphilum]|uniref:efflux RND transporter periplasmic adaptor subunit n=1 Tax=Novosphingobium acidiphilum TaxID=505248 RepID=UPI00048C15FC|nr:efflux RND transporter periplasmic adaptor subunit [Novosphingobium acidiphilum]
MSDISPLQNPPPRGLRAAGIAIGAAALVIVLVGSVLRMHDGYGAQQWSTAQATPTVRLISPRSTAANATLVQPGTIEAWTEAKIFARVPGYIHAWYTDIGDRVVTGATLGRIDTPELDQQIIQARAALVRARAEAMLARTTSARWQDLLRSTAVSRQEADEKAADSATRAAGVDEARASLGRLLALKAYSTVSAPFAGVITLRNADIGDLVGPGATTQQPMFALADDRSLRVYVDVPQRYAPQMTKGLVADLSVPAWPGRVFAARVIGQSGGVDTKTGALRVELLADNADRRLKPGGFAQVSFRLPVPAGEVTIPASALILRGGTRVATVDRAGRVRMLAVTIGRDMGSMVEITAGLSAATRIIDSPPDSLQDGDTVRVAAHG